MINQIKFLEILDNDGLQAAWDYQFELVRGLTDHYNALFMATGENNCSERQTVKLQRAVAISDANEIGREAERRGIELKASL